MDNIDKMKRERSANFKLRERDILISLVEKYQSILENKQSDGTTWKKKEAAWESIKTEFNARSGVFRTTKTLKVKYEGLKRTVRKKCAAIRSELYRTGGGSNTAPPLDCIDQKIKAMITLSTDGLESIYDSDVLPNTQESQDIINNSMMTEEEQPLSEQMEIQQIENSSPQNKVLLLAEDSSVIIVDDCGLPGSSKETDTKNALPEQDSEIDISLPVTPKGNTFITPTILMNKKWDVTSRKNLKSKKHPALIAKARNQQSSFDELTQAKLEVVELQKKHLEAEIEEKKKEWVFKEKERQWKEEEYKLRLEKLRKELNE